MIDRDQLSEALDPARRQYGWLRVIEEAAQAWLDFPTDEQREVLIPLIRELIEMARRSATDPDWLGSLDATVWALAMLEAVRRTMIGEVAAPNQGDTAASRGGEQ